MASVNQVICTAVVLCALCVVGSNGQGGGQTTRGDCGNLQFGNWYQDQSTPCSKEYEVCRSFVWRKLKCVLGHFNFTTGQCQRFPGSSNCPNNDNSNFPMNTRKRRDASELSTLSHRSKRQATDCSSTDKYWCPNNVDQVVVYPDFDNLSCTTYYLCYQGQLSLGNCTGNYIFYNPRLMSCEEYPALTNTCVWREWADNSPFTGTSI